jgi:hypothetical protein
MERQRLIDTDAAMSDQLTRTDQNIATLRAALAGARNGIVSFGDAVATPITPSERGGSGRGAGGGGGAVRPSARELIDTPSLAAPAWRGLNEELAQSNTAMDGIAEAITGPFKDALRSGEISFRTFASAVAQVADNLASKLIDDVFRRITDGLSRALSGGGSGSGGGGFLMTVLGAFGSALGGSIGGGLSGSFGGVGGSASGIGFGAGGFAPASLAPGTGFSPTPFALGSAFDRSGAVVTRPTLFAFARGTGLMGEAGPEAILPLRRGPGGRLGVEAGSARQQPEQTTKIVNVLDPGLVGDFLATASGERVIMNVLRRNRVV